MSLVSSVLAVGSRVSFFCGSIRVYLDAFRTLALCFWMIFEDPRFIVGDLHPLG